MELAAEFIGSFAGSYFMAYIVTRHLFFRAVPIAMTIYVMCSVWRYRRTIRKLIATREHFLNRMEM